MEEDHDNGLHDETPCEDCPLCQQLAAEAEEESSLNYFNVHIAGDR